VVGQNEELSGKMRKESIATTFTRFLNRPYSSAGDGPDGYGCLNFVYEFLCARGLGDKLIIEMDDLDLTNYMCFAEEASQEEVREKLVRIFEMNGKPVDTLRPGDAVVLKSETGRYFPAIYAGGGNVASSFSNAGVQVNPMAHYELICARRVE
jgi:hypothetical protein